MHAVLTQVAFFRVWLEWIRTAGLLFHMLVFRVFYLHLLSSDLFGGKAMQSLARHITLAEVLTHLRLQIKLVWLKCHCCPPPILPYTSFSWHCWLQTWNGWAALELLPFITQHITVNWHWFWFSFMLWPENCSSSRAGPPLHWDYYSQSQTGWSWTKSQVSYSNPTQESLPPLLTGSANAIQGLLCLVLQGFAKPLPDTAGICAGHVWACYLERLRSKLRMTQNHTAGLKSFFWHSLGIAAEYDSPLHAYVHINWH